MEKSALFLQVMMHFPIISGPRFQNVAPTPSTLFGFSRMQTEATPFVLKSRGFAALAFVYDGNLALGSDSPLPRTFLLL